MISRYSHQGLVWIDIESPTKEEITLLSEEYKLHPVISNELLEASDRSKVDLYENAVYLVLHFPVRNRSSGHIEETEIDFVLMKDVLITTHYELIDSLHDFAKLFETGSYFHTAKVNEHSGFLFFSQMRELYKHTVFLLESVSHDIRDIEKRIFAGEEADMVSHISTANRALIDIRQSLRFHKETIKSFSEACVRLYGNDFSYYVSMIEGEYGRIEQLLGENREMLHDLRNTNDSLLSVKTNATIRWLTAVNLIIMPITLIADIYAMHSRYLYLDEPGQLAIVLGGMVLIGIVSVIYFRYKKWL